MKLLQHIIKVFLFASLFNLNIPSPAVAQSKPVQIITVARLPIINGPHGTTDFFNLPLQVRPLEITGFVSVNATGEIAIAELRAFLNSAGELILDSKGNGRSWHRIVMFDSTGKQTQNIPLPARPGEQALYIGLSGDGSIWLNPSSLLYGHIIRKISRTGSILFEFGQYPTHKELPSYSSKLRSTLTNQYNHRWGKKYEGSSLCVGYCPNSNNILPVLLIFRMI